MKFSIVTPTHKITPYLLELFESLEAQTYEDWEWELFLNGSAKIDDLPDAIKACVQVNITESGITEGNIGLIKNEAFSRGTGDILVEVDHDDLLMPECLEKLAEAFSDDSVGFAYSDDLLYDTRGGQKIRWSPAYGWTENYKEFRGENYYAPESFPPTARSMSFIWYAPDHVRAWRKTTYEELGGHDRTLEVCDDHDLLLRTYLHTNMKHVPETLYVYRLLDNNDNTFLKRNEEIQIKTRELFNKYARTLAEHDADKAGLLKIDLGGGLYPYPGYTTIDQEGADIVYDLNNGIPLPDNSVGVINASHVIEHLKDPVKTMSEIHRVLCDGGWAFIDVPSTDGRGAFQDPTHVSFWNENSFWYYTRRQQAQYIRNESIRFQAFKLETTFDTEWDKQHNIPVVKAVLCAVKSNERRPHMLEI
jgi:glycosyltransferase involved in cell wall biosynthesis